MKKKLEKFFNKFFWNSWLVGLSSLVWLLLRTGTKPTRVIYPCQQVARANIFVFGLPVVVPFWLRLKKCKRFRLKVLSLTSVTLFLVVGAFGFMRAKTKLVSWFWQTKGLPKKESRVLAATNSRVVWIADNNATSGWSGDSSRVNAGIVQRMTDDAIRALTGRNTVRDAWTSIFQNHNGGRDYSPGEKIAIKVNFNNSWGGGSDNNCYQDHCPTYQAVNALLRQLVEEKGILEGNINVYDTSRSFPDYFIDGVSSRFSGVKLNQYGGEGSSASVRGASLGRALAEADYLINMPLLRTHGATGVTLSFKNHLGSTGEPSAFHDAFFGSSVGSNSLVQLNRHPFIRDKTILVVDDALYGLRNGGPGGEPDGALGIKPYPNSLFLSTDPVAVDSVMTDYLELKDGNMWGGGDPRTYMRVAASDGLGNHATSCSGSGCSFSYSSIDLVRCDPNCPGTSPPPASPTPTPTPSCAGPGDVDCDGDIDKDDALAILRNWLSLSPDPVRADANGDGKVNALDVVIVLANWD